VQFRRRSSAGSWPSPSLTGTMTPVPMSTCSISSTGSSIGSTRSDRRSPRRPREKFGTSCSTRRESHTPCRRSTSPEHLLRLLESWLRRVAARCQPPRCWYPCRLRGGSPIVRSTEAAQRERISRPRRVIVSLVGGSHELLMRGEWTGTTGWEEPLRSRVSERCRTRRLARAARETAR
jgi:hypothetical protein